MIRSRKYLDAAKNQPCQLRFANVCLDPHGQGHETTVFAHFRCGKGMGQKAHDFDGSDACFACHTHLDTGWAGKTSWTLVLEHMLRGLERTLENRIRRGVVVFPITVQQPSAERPVKPRKPREERPKIAQRVNPWPAKGSRPLRRKYEIEESTK